jgi:hypothetical protein
MIQGFDPLPAADYASLQELLAAGPHLRELEAKQMGPFRALLDGK